MSLEAEMHELLTYDPVTTAIKVTGQSFMNPETAELAKVLADKAAEERRLMFEFWGDVYAGCEWAYYALTVRKRMGFKMIFERDGYAVFFEQKTGCLLSVRHNQMVLESTVFYNWRPAGTMAGIPPNFSVGWFERETDRVWAGHRDAREGLKTHLEFLKSRGEFVTPWVGDPMLVLGIQPQRGQSTAATEEVLAALPVAVQRVVRVRHN